MNDRIARIIKDVQTRNQYAPLVKVQYDEFDEKLAEPLRIAKRLTEYMAAQDFNFTEDNELVGQLRFDGTVESDLFPRIGHKAFKETCSQYYNNPQENLCTFEWQHSNADFGKIIRIGLTGFRKEIIQSRAKHLGDMQRLNFLAGLESIIRGISRRADQCAAECRRRAALAADPIRKQTLLRMARNCSRVPMNPAETFEEAIQCVYFCFSFLYDSIGRPDQYLLPLYRKGIADGTLTQEHARELLQELYCRIHAATPFQNGNWDKGAESHFVVGGYDIDHNCAYNELSDLILDSLFECDLIRPQVSLRWNNKTPRNILYKVMDYERRDKNKRFAFVNDEPRIKSIMEIAKYPWEIAYDYIMVGCNEPAFQGGISLGGDTVNILRSLTNTLSQRRAEVLECTSFDEFYAIYEQELFRDLDTINDYSNRFNMLRSRDCNVLSSLFLDGCIERAVSVTQGGATKARVAANMMGAVNVIDSLSVIKDFVFEQKCVSMENLLKALDEDWNGFADLRNKILEKAKFFGNNDDFSNEIARRFYKSIYNFADGRTELFGFSLMYGNLTGYNTHFARFGALTPATPDGRVAGSALMFGSGQSDGKDRDGATSHLLSVAHMDPTGIMCANSIMNLSVTEDAVQNQDSFEKLVILVETYFKEGGLHIQLNHVSRKELLEAQKLPENYKNLRVRVSGFSAYFVKLHEDIQKNIIARTENNIAN